MPKKKPVSWNYQEQFAVVEEGKHVHWWEGEDNKTTVVFYNFNSKPPQIKPLTLSLSSEEYKKFFLHEEPDENALAFVKDKVLGVESIVHNPQTKRTIGYVYIGGSNEEKERGIIRNFGRIESRTEFVEFKDTNLDTNSTSIIQLQCNNLNPDESVNPRNNRLLGIIQNRFVFSQVQHSRESPLPLIEVNPSASNSNIIVRQLTELPRDKPDGAELHMWETYQEDTWILPVPSNPFTKEPEQNALVWQRRVFLWNEDTQKLDREVIVRSIDGWQCFLHSNFKVSVCKLKQGSECRYFSIISELVEYKWTGSSTLTLIPHVPWIFDVTSVTPMGELGLLVFNNEGDVVLYSPAASSDDINNGTVKELPQDLIDSSGMLYWSDKFSTLYSFNDEHSTGKEISKETLTSAPSTAIKDCYKHEDYLKDISISVYSPPEDLSAGFHRVSTLVIARDFVRTEFAWRPKELKQDLSNYKLVAGWNCGQYKKLQKFMVDDFKHLDSIMDLADMCGCAVVFEGGIGRRWEFGSILDTQHQRRSSDSLYICTYSSGSYGFTTISDYVKWIAVLAYRPKDVNSPDNSPRANSRKTEGRKDMLLSFSQGSSVTNSLC